MKPTLLIVGTLSDPHVLSVCENLDSDCVPLVLDYSEYLRKFSASFRYSPSDGPSFCVTPMGATLERVKCIWWRRPLEFRVDNELDSELQRFVRIQHEFFWTSLLGFLPGDVRWYNDWRSDLAADRNLSLLQLASLSGLRVPSTLVTTSMNEATTFMKEYTQTIVKSFGGSQKYWRPTRLASEELLTELWSQSSYPIIIQEYITGGTDYRVVLIDNHVFSIEFDTGNSTYQYDVRVDQNALCREVELEQPLVAALKSMLAILGLRYGAFDLRRNESGELVFFELNPAGQFLYLDIRAGTKIAATFARVLCQN